MMPMAALSPSRNTCPAPWRCASRASWRPIIARPNLPVFRIGLKCFFEEGRALARIVHPNVVRVLNFFRANETVYMVMAYESGQSLQEHIARLGLKGSRAGEGLHPQDLQRRLRAACAKSTPTSCCTST
jgi:hypothetical protein